MVEKQSGRKKGILIAGCCSQRSQLGHQSPPVHCAWKGRSREGSGRPEAAGFTALREQERARQDPSESPTLQISFPNKSCHQRSLPPWVPSKGNKTEIQQKAKGTWRKTIAHVCCVPFPRQASKVEIFYSRVSHSPWRKFYFRHDAALKRGLITKRSAFSLQHFPKEKGKWTPSFYSPVCYLKIWSSRSSCLFWPSFSFALKWKFFFFFSKQSFFLSHSMGWAVCPEMWPLHKGTAFPMDGFIRGRRHEAVQTGPTSYTPFRRNLDTTQRQSSTQCLENGWLQCLAPSSLWSILLHFLPPAPSTDFLVLRIWSEVLFTEYFLCVKDCGR